MKPHTPGPWVVYHITGSNDRIQRMIGAPRPSGGYRAVARAEAGGGEATKADANARLIAAAPELLEASKAVVDCWGLGRLNITAMTEFVLELRTTIAKAEGNAP